LPGLQPSRKNAPMAQAASSELRAARQTAAGGLPDAEGVFARAPGENFSVASALLGREAQRHLIAIYGYARLVDQIGDASPGDRLALLDELESELAGIFDGTNMPTHAVLVRLARTIGELRLPPGPFQRLIEANRLDQRKHDYATFRELVAYCSLSADPVGELVLHVFGAATPERIALSDKVCTALQLVEHWQDVAEDRAAGRIYLPAEDRARFEVAPTDLDGDVAPQQVRNLLAFEVARARDLLDEGALLVGTLHGRARIAVAGYVGGGRAALDAIAASGYDVLAGAPRAGRRRRARAALVTYARRGGA
jgi:squalene synthase HpnC